MTSNYRLKVGSKTRFLNIFRRIFQFTFFENMLSRKTRDASVDSFWARLIPPNYMYKKGSERNVERRGIKYSLDINDYVEHGVFFGYRDAGFEELLNLARGRKIIIDVGVNIGSTILNFSRLSPDGKMIGFEPDSKNFLKARRNLELNNFANVTLINKGLGEKSEKVKLFNVNANNAGMKRVLNASSSEPDVNLSFDEIEIITLDSFIEEKDIPQIDLIKIDVEGYEFKVLTGAKKSLQNYLPILFIELDDENLKAQGNSAQALTSFLECLGYKIYRADDQQPITSSDNFNDCHFDIICKF